jgi:hypothetical protein
MEMEKICFEVDKETAHKFNAALMLNKEELNIALGKCLKSYIKETFLTAADINDRKTEITENASAVVENNFAKARGRIPKWAQNPTQIIIKS